MQRAIEAAKQFFSLIWRAVTQFNADGCMQLASSLAYYTVFSLAPLLVIVISISSLIFEPDKVETEIGKQLNDLAGHQAASQIQSMVEHTSKEGHGWLGAGFGFVFLLFGATGMVAQLQRSLNRVWKVQVNPERGAWLNFLVKRSLSFGMILGIAFLLLVSLTVSTLLTAFGANLVAYLPESLSQNLLFAMHELASLAIITILFACLLKFLPDAKIRWRDVWLGAVVTAVLFTIGKYLLEQHLARTDVGSAFGAAGSLAILLLWVYYSSLIFLFGAEFTHVWVTRNGRRVRPIRGAIRVIYQPVRENEDGSLEKIN